MADLERAILIGISLPKHKKEECFESLQELVRLAETAGVEVVDKIIQVRHEIHPKQYLGKGKLEELKEELVNLEIDLIIFDDDLSPLQVRNIESELQCKVLGRTELILDIFASRARTRESKLQVEYAQLSYLLPRLTRRWTHLSRIKGGIGFRGPGETQLEVDRRVIKKRLHLIKKQLDKIAVQFDLRRKTRENQFVVCLVGYTNAGKSTLHNVLAKGKVFVEDALFATLDSTVRKVYISDALSVLLVDTVGFIKKLPHNLVASFKSTLKEVETADLLLHVVDITEINVIDQIKAVNQVLMELKTLSKPSILVFNKIDRLADPSNLPVKVVAYSEKSCFISAGTGEGVQLLKDMIEQTLIPKPSDAALPK